MGSKKFDAKKYADQFEELSLEILEITYFQGERHDDIIKQEHTQKTRDNGVDGYIKFSFQNTICTYTVEAKLRTSSKLGLRDFASSIIYSLINFSTKHFVVTNILYSDEAIRVIEQLRRQNKGNIDLIDGKKLQGIINSQLTLFDKYPNSLINYIRSKSFPVVSAQSTVATQEITKENTYLLSSKKHNALSGFLTDFNSKSMLYLVEGKKGTGKTSFIHNFLQTIMQSHSGEYHEINMGDVKTPYLFCMEIVQIVTGIDLLCLVSYLSKEDKDSILGDDLFSDDQEEIASAVKILLDEKSVDLNTHRYYIKKLLPKIIGSRDSEHSLFLYFSHLEKVDIHQLELLLDTLICFTQNQVRVIVEFQNPVSQKEIPQVNIDDWYNILHQFKTYHDSFTGTSHTSMDDYSATEKTELLKLFLPKGLPEAYYLDAVNTLGCNPEMFHLGLNYIKSRKLFTIPLINSSRDQLRDINVFYDNIYRFHSQENPYISLINYAIAAAKLLEGDIPQKILDICSSRYQCDAKTILTDSQLFIEDYFELRIASQHIFSISSLCDYKSMSDAQIDILTNIQDLFRQEYDQNYYICIIHILQRHIDPKEIQSILTNLKDRRDIRRIENLLYSLYKEMLILKYDNISMLHVITEYLNFITNQYLYYTRKSEEMFLAAEKLYQSVILSDLDGPDRVEVLLKYYKLMYHKSKMCYDNDACKKYVQNILEYESTSTKYTSYFIAAHRYKALLYKEQGFYRKQFREYVDAIRKYPQNKELKIAFGMNAAAYYYYKNPSKAMKIMMDLIRFTNENGDDFRKHLWLYHDFQMMKLYNNSFDLNELLHMREFAEKISASNILARSYNMEGFWCFKAKNYLDATDKFEVAVNISKMSGSSKPYFLFLANLITAKIMLGEDISTEFTEAISWIKQHALIIHQRLDHTKKLETEHLYAALVSYLISGLSFPQIQDTIYRLINEDCCSIPYKKKELLLEQVHTLYHINDQILILY